VDVEKVKSRNSIVMGNYNVTSEGKVIDRKARVNDVVVMRQIISIYSKDELMLPFS